MANRTLVKLREGIAKVEGGVWEESEEFLERRERMRKIINRARKFEMETEHRIASEEEYVAMRRRMREIEEEIRAEEEESDRIREKWEKEKEEI